MDCEKANSDQRSGERVVDAILKQLTPENIQKQIQEIQAIELPQDIQKWIKEYEKVGQRNNFFWKFMYKINVVINPLRLPDHNKDTISEIKFLIIMFVILLDDIADKTKNGKLLSVLLKIPFEEEEINIEHFNNDEKTKAYIEFSIKLWHHIRIKIKESSNYTKVKEVLNFDLKQILNAMNYSFLINQNPFLINNIEYWIYPPHTFLGILFNTIDVMFLEEFDMEELGIIREIIFRAQTMGRIGNCLSTWKREIKEGDFTNGIISYAISSGVLKVSELNEKNRINNIIDKINQSGIKNALLKKWQQYYDEINSLCEKTKFIDAANFSSQLEELFLLYLASEDSK